jgi:metal-responsive CopG/Arc/MetJ family transcriptional regulator
VTTRRSDSGDAVRWVDYRYDSGYTFAVKTAISIPDELYRAAERAAEQLGLSRSELYRRALGAYLRERENEVVTKALDEVYGSAAEDSHVDPRLARMQNATIESEEW